MGSLLEELARRETEARERVERLVNGWRPRKRCCRGWWSPGRRWRRSWTRRNGRRGAPVDPVMRRWWPSLPGL